MLFEFDDDDFVPIRRCSLAWRWTSPTHAELPADDLKQIQAIAGAKAATLNDFVVDRWPRLGVNPAYPLDLRRLHTEDEDEVAVRAWLLALPIDTNSTVIVSWDWSTAVVAPFALVAEYWSDFFYPASDDAAVIPRDVAWMLVWNHEEVFEFGSAQFEPDRTL